MKRTNATTRSMHLGSTIWFKSIKDYRAAIGGQPSAPGQKVSGVENNYGIEGNPTQHELQEAICKLEEAEYSYLYPTGMMALAGVFDALSGPGDHLLLPDVVYGPTRLYCDEMLAARGIEADYYSQTDVRQLEKLIKDNSKLILIETPGSATFELADIDGIRALARENNLITAIDNTWASGYLYKPLVNGIDISIMSATKYIGGHSDLFLGTVATNSDVLSKKIARHHMLTGIYISPFEAALAVRGLETLEARLRLHAENVLKIKALLESQSAVSRVLIPDLKSPDFNKYFRGLNGLISVELNREYGDGELEPFIGELKVFGLGESWGATQSKVLLFQPDEFSKRSNPPSGTVLRFSSGLEPINDQLSDLEAAFSKIPG